MGKKKSYTVKTLYTHIANHNHKSGTHMKHVWKDKIPPKIKMFMLFIENKVLLTKDNMARRGWIGDLSCCFCYQHESIDHLFLAIQWAE